MAQQTAVEWLEEELADNLKVIVLNKDYTLMEKIFAKAKAMEKEQIVDAWDGGDYAYFYSKETGRDFDNGEQYYNETYNK